MALFLTALTVTVGAYAALMLAVARFAARAPLSPTRTPEDRPRLAVLVAARNEEANLPRCLDALLAQDYPVGRLDIFVADDHSTDTTAAVVQRYQQRTVGVLADGVDAAEAQEAPAVHYVRVPDTNGHLHGKANAIHAAVEACDHDLLIVTDADCAPPPGWARRHAAYLADPELGMVCGHADVEAATTFEAMQALDWTFLLTTASVFVEAGRPVTAMGNNMAFRRAAYEAVGGYPALPFSVTEDYVLFKTVADRSGFRVRFPLDPALRVRTLPLHSLADVYKQRRRWARGGLRAPAWVYALYGVHHLAHLLPLVALFAAPLWAAGALAVKLGADYTLLRTTLGIAGRRPLLRAFPRFEAYLFFYTITLPTVLTLFPRIRWKDRRL